MSVKILKKTKALGNEYIALSGVTGKTVIKTLEKRYKGEFRLIGGKPVIVKPLKKTSKKKSTKKRTSKRK